MNQLPSTERVLQACQRMGLAVSAAEIHGGLCGWLAGGGADVAGWPAKVLADDTLAAPAPDSVLDELRQCVVAQLEDRDFGFDLLLPSPERPIDERAEALFEWCRGFLGGFGLAVGANPPLSEEGQEALQDIAKLAQATAGDIDSDEDDESALLEIEEFVRVAALLLHGDCVLAPRHRQRLN